MCIISMPAPLEPWRGVQPVTKAATGPIGAVFDMN